MEFDGETIGGDKIVGQSNRCRSDTVEVVCQSGSLFVFVLKKERDYINKKTSLIQNERGF